MLVVLSLVPLTTSLLFALTKLSQTDKVRLIVPNDNDELSFKVPRHIDLVKTTESVWDLIKGLHPTDIVVLVKEPLLFSPDALVLAHLCAKEQLGKYFAFVDSTGKADSRGVQFCVGRHWSVGGTTSTSFAVSAQTLQDDVDVWKELWTASSLLQWNALEVLQSRTVLSPLPSLAAPLPLGPTSPPGLNWTALQDLINKSA